MQFGHYEFTIKMKMEHKRKEVTYGRLTMCQVLD